MRVATVDGLITLFYDGSKELWNEELDQELKLAYYDERTNLDDSVEETLYKIDLWDISNESDTVIRIERFAFFGCRILFYIKLSINLDYIANYAFNFCDLSSIFIPPSCREIGNEAFEGNANLTILNVSQNTELGHQIISSTKLLESCPHTDSEAINTWLKNINLNDQFVLHRVCSSFEPTLDMIVDTMKEKGGPKAFQVENSIGITPSRYLKENPYADVKEKDIIKKYTLQMTGEL